MVTRGNLSLRIPPTWHLNSKQVTVSYSAMANLVTELLPVNTYDGTVQLAHPYESIERFVSRGHAHFALRFEARGGNLYQLSLTAPATQQALIDRIIQTLTLPPIATATTLVHQFNTRHAAKKGVSYIRTTCGASRWLLVFGNPATAMENYDLFHSTNGGRTWALINATAPLAPAHQSPHVFPGSLGQPAMFFWTPTKGIIVEATGFARQGLLVYRTTNAGQTWQSQALGPLGQITGDTPPHIADRQGVITVSVRLKSGRTFRMTSTHDAKTWHPQ